MEKQALIAHCLTYPNAVEDYPFADNDLTIMRHPSGGKWFACIMHLQGKLCINLKCDPVRSEFLRRTYKGVYPAWHMNKEHWNTILLDGTVPDDAVRTMIAESYDIITDSPTKRIYEAVKQIPRGKVATYGQIAALAGEPKMARAVGNALHKNTDPEHIPCYRVVNSKGELAAEFVFGGAGKQADMLEADGIVLENGRVNLKKYGINVEEMLAQRELEHN